MKNNLMVDIEERRVRYLSHTYAGRIHDKRICDEEDYTFPPGCILFKDTGFQGFEPERVSTYQPALHKKYPLTMLFVCKTGLFDLEKPSKRDQKVLIDR